MGPEVTKLGKPVTSSATDVTNAPAQRWPERWGLSAKPARWVAIWAVCVLITAVVNALSLTTDLTRRDIAFNPLEPWIWELSSAAGLLVLGWPVWAFARLLRERRAGPSLQFALHVAASALFCAAHVAMMVGLRIAIYRFNGWRYEFGPWLDGLLYEYRKDALTYALFVGCIWLWRSATASAALGAGARDAATLADAAPAAPAPPAEPTFVVRTSQGDLLVRTAEIEWVEAQGNYVALHTAGEVRLLRQTLAEMDARLAPHGFIRTHRSALVNRSRIQAIVPPERGEPGVRLTGGGRAPLSESRRGEVLRLVSGA
jgi:LytTr DNA-binding domain